MQLPNSVQRIYLTGFGLYNWFEKKAFVDVQKTVIFNLGLSESVWRYPSQCFKSWQRVGVEIWWNPLQTESPKYLDPQKIAIKIKFYSNPILRYCKVMVHILECWNTHYWFKKYFSIYFRQTTISNRKKTLLIWRLLSFLGRVFLSPNSKQK